MRMILHPYTGMLRLLSSQVMRNAKALVIFTAMREGLWISGAGGSGILVARKADGTWSHPSGIMVHTIDLNFIAGVDIYDCVVVINSHAALDTLMSTRCTLGHVVEIAIGPTDSSESVDSDHQWQAPVWTYLKSRGFYAVVPMNGTVIIERTDENERFYGGKIGVGDILAGKARYPAREIKSLIETIKAAQGEEDFDERALPKEGAPGDIQFDKPGRVFGIPESDDPDPYGVHALEMEGLEIREAGTRSRPSSDQFEYRPSPTSPIYQSYFHRRSTSSLTTRTRETFKRNSSDRGVRMTDRATQTVDEPLKDLPEADHEHVPNGVIHNGIDRTPSEGSLCNVQGETYEEAQAKEENNEEAAPNGHQEFSDVDMTDGSSIDEFHDVHEEVRAQAASQVILKAKLVTIPRRSPPPLPPRSAARKKIVVNGDLPPLDDHVGISNGDVVVTNTTTLMATGHRPEESHWRELPLQTAS